MIVMLKGAKNPTLILSFPSVEYSLGVEVLGKFQNGDNKSFTFLVVLSGIKTVEKS
jgi:hypothetical protein